MKVRALIVDDEPIARRELARLLESHPDVEIVGEAETAENAVRRVQALQPDLLFLDVQMPGGTGFDALEQMESIPRVIFTTAYDEFALRAFEVNALDYLLKPIDAKRLAAALDRLDLPEMPATRSEGSSGPLGLANRLFVREGDQCWLLQLADVVLFEADGKQTRVVFADQAPAIRHSLKALESRLAPESFFRANRSTIIGLRHVQAVDAWFGDRLRVTLRGDRHVELSRRQSQLFRRIGL